MRETVLSLFLLLTAGSAIADEVSRISRVTLYPGAATVERVARVVAGSSRLEIAGLPAGFDIATIRLEADAGIRLGEFTVRDVAAAEAPNPRQAALEAKIEALGDQLARLDIERQSAELVTAYLKGLGTGGKEAGVDTRNLAVTLAAIRQGGADALARIQRAEQDKRGLVKQREALERELAKLAADSRDTRLLSVSLAAEKGGEVRVSYRIDGPGWQPLYRATLDSASGRVVVERQALIAQNSGEDWSAVALRLSTGQPRANAQGQPPRPWQLYLREASVATRAMAPMAAAPAPVMQGMERAMLAKTPAAPLFEVSELQAAFATEFEVPARISLPSDGRRVTVALGRSELPVRLRVQVEPRRDRTAWLVAEAERPAGVWLPGDLQLYRDGSSVGLVRWAPQEGERFELPFGRDELIQVTVRDETPKNERSGFIEQRRERSIASSWTIASRHRQALALQVIESAPVSTDAQVNVDSRYAPQPDQLAWQGHPGIVAWNLELAPGQSRSFSAGYTVSWPKDAQLIGF